MKIERDFFATGPLQCARNLIGCELIRGTCRGRIVETEAYAENGDPACHTATRPSAREFICSHPAGTAYVYFNYGMHWLFNVLTQSESDGNGLILIRAIQPVDGLRLMRTRRAACLRHPPADHDRWLCSGPAKLAAALDITGQDHGRDLCKGSTIRLAHRTGAAPEILATPRIGISKAIDFPWRFVEAGSRYLSRPCP